MADELTFAQERSVAMAMKVVALQKELAKAWDAGYQARKDEDVNIGGTMNPYRGTDEDPA